MITIDIRTRTVTQHSDNPDNRSDLDLSTGFLKQEVSSHAAVMSWSSPTETLRGASSMRAARSRRVSSKCTAVTNMCSAVTNNLGGKGSLVY